MPQTDISSSSNTPAHPFGVSITSEDIVETLSFLDDWEQRYRYLIDLGKELPEMAVEKQQEEFLIRGCQSSVWLHYQIDDDRYWFEADSDAYIVRGLVGLVLAAFNGKTSQEILDFNVDEYFERLELLNHLTPTRGNGVRSMVDRIRFIAREV